MDRELLQYLPTVVRDMREMRTIMATEQPETELLWIGSENALCDQFVLESTGNGVSRWEKILKIIPKEKDTLDARKQRILILLNQRLPYTWRVLIANLNQICGKEEVSARLFHNDYLLQIDMDSKAEKYRETIEDMLTRILPANITREMRINDALSHTLQAVGVYHNVASTTIGEYAIDHIYQGNTAILGAGMSISTTVIPSFGEIITYLTTESNAGLIAENNQFLIK